MRREIFKRKKTYVAAADGGTHCFPVFEYFQGTEVEENYNSNTEKKLTTKLNLIII